jgi:hypothetical protein
MLKKFTKHLSMSPTGNEEVRNNKIKRCTDSKLWI